MSEFRGDAFLEPLGNEMFKPLSLLVNFFDRVIEDLIKKRFDQPMMAQDFKRTTPPLRRQSNTATLFVFDIRRLIRSELLQHVGNRCWRDSKALCKSRARNASLFRSAEAKNRLQIVVHGFGIGIDLTIGRHSSRQLE